MPGIVEGPPAPDAPPKPLLLRLGWFAFIWIASFAVTALVVALMRALVR